MKPLTKQEYKVISKGSYEVSVDGKIRDLVTKKELTGSVGQNGYINVSCKKAGYKFNPYLHRLIAETWLEKVNGKEQVNHKNGIRTDNRVENLEWCTHTENMRHSFAELGRKSGRLGKKGQSGIINITSKPVAMLDKQNKVLKVFGSTAEASRYLGLSISSVFQVLYGKNQTAGGYKFTRVSRQEYANFN